MSRADAKSRGVVNINALDFCLNIQMFGGFVFHLEDKSVSEQSGKSSKEWKLLQYLIIHRNKDNPVEELIEAFCEDKTEDSKKKLGAMIKSVIADLKKRGMPDAEDFIIAKNGGYAWNSKIPCKVDSEEFESLYDRSGAEVKDDERLELLMKAIDLFNGGFLPDSANDKWAVPLVRRYHTMYLSCVYDALLLLNIGGQDKEIEMLCVSALRVDPFDKKILEYYLRALLAQGEKVKAHNEYEKMESMFYDLLGVEFSDNLRTLYSNIMQPVIQEGIPLESVVGEWLDGANYPGAYYCDLSIFKAIYQIESRSAARSGRTTYLISFEFKHEPGKIDGGVMKQLGKAIPSRLRKDDLFTRAGPNQYILMLQNLTYEDCRMLVERIISAIDTKHLTEITGITIKQASPVEWRKEVDSQNADERRKDPFDEKALEFHLRSLMAQGKDAEALYEYERMERMFSDFLGVSFSENMRNLYDQIQKPEIVGGQPLEDVLNEWLDGADFPGAFYCDLSLFKTMYQIGSRSIARSGKGAYLVRLDTRKEPGAKDGGVMKQLGMEIPGRLRMGDLFTLASPNQYLIMLHNITEDDCNTLVTRIKSSIDEKYLTKIEGTTIMPVIPSS